ncbi:hypothetical protein FLP41_03020 (plasmid) [Paracoccus marcusii]|nr:hypothetical protein FLP41_03020 [Paracoccus marcusii]
MDRPQSFGRGRVHGNYCAYKYDLRTYSPVGAILFDHPTRRSSPC